MRAASIRFAVLEDDSVVNAIPCFAGHPGERGSEPNAARC